jgi:CARDB
VRFFAIILLALGPAASVAAGAKPDAAQHSASARLKACSAQAQSATFRGQMANIEPASGFDMRFILQTRTPAGPAWSRVAGVWGDLTTRSAPFQYDRTVTELVPGDYRAVVRFRWHVAKGDVLVKTVKRTRGCRIPDERANLEALRITSSAGSEESTRFYAVRVANTGDSDAPPFSTRMDIGGFIPPEEATGEPLRPTEQDTLDFEAPRCDAGSTVTATLDTGAAVDETDEMDNVLTVPCPTR